MANLKVGDIVEKKIEMGGLKIWVLTLKILRIGKKHIRAQIIESTRPPNVDEPGRVLKLNIEYFEQNCKIIS